MRGCSIYAATEFGRRKDTAFFSHVKKKKRKKKIPGAGDAVTRAKYFHQTCRLTEFFCNFATIPLMEGGMTTRL